MTPKRRVLVVDDSALVRNILKVVLAAHPDLEVVGEAADPYEAREQITRLQPDVLTLDVEMPRMDGLTFLTKVMRHHPMPVVMVSSLTARGTAVAMEALERGAVDVVGKPEHDPLQGLEAMGQAIAEAVHAASYARVRVRAPAAAVQPRLGPDAVLPLLRPGRSRALSEVIAIGSSTGGTEALKEILPRLPAGLPPILLVQHILPGFTSAFARQLDRLCQVPVREAVDGEEPQDSTIYLGPSDYHLTVAPLGNALRLRLVGGARVSRHLPSVDVLFRSVAVACGPKALGIILTGMGDDGAQGLLEMRQAGATTLGQDEESCLIYGMPRMAHERGGVQKLVPLKHIAKYIVGWNHA
ncbi:protein-glutamate methylesterase/protein-glutamine glutaminase [Mesoterricola silvestris]|uniref:Protein-glutamate methylesterase/protein-glutamine glutaminase n=1 Tax=Mesoterricola silvestris TaxID=2927979 RepID=A0AA48GRB1_9BACT|nr:chemotaxis response regulator protein-glutamate methylesterase [Mesoterricola silvestris]BDU72587.1 chemotaxis response regulator protein-glutamate methylesterase of group 3 operon [Mesoterricola silvestris]